MTGYNKTSLGRASFIAGIALLVSAVAAPLAEFFIYPALVVSGSAEETTKNIIAKAGLFRTGIFCYMLTFFCDIVLAWALYILLKPVNENLSLLTAWLRLIYTIMAVIALVNLVVVARLLITSNNSTILTPDQLYAQVKISLTEFRTGWSFSFVFFGIHLVLLGYLIIRSKYIPSILGILLIITGLGWFISNLRPVFFSQLSISSTIINIAGSFELIFMLWLLIKGARLKEAY
jgi:hypothetical protein